MNFIFMRFPKGKAKALTLSYDDGVQQDMRLISILNKHGLKCTFNINTGLFSPEGTQFPEGQIHRRMTEKEAVALYKDSGHEIAVHALTHPFLEQLPTNIVMNEILEDRKNLERLFGTITRGMAYPFGTYSDEVVAVLKSAGIAYARTVHSTESFQLPTDWLRLPATCHHDNPNLIKLTNQFISETPWNAPWLFYLWGHSYEFEEKNNWNVIEEFSEKVGGREDIWYATNIEVYDYIQAYKQLIFSVDSSMVHNPTATVLYFNHKRNLYEIKPGETLTL
jgi:peptidoglycan/xylan/chitin deacetylase (PgdA/CDA1 family)